MKVHLLILFIPYSNVLGLKIEPVILSVFRREDFKEFSIEYEQRTFGRTDLLLNID